MPKVVHSLKETKYTIHKYNIASFYSQLGQTLEVAIESFKTDKNQEGKRNLWTAETSPAAAHCGSHLRLVPCWESSERTDRAALEIRRRTSQNKTISQRTRAIFSSSFLSGWGEVRLLRWMPIKFLNEACVSLRLIYRLLHFNRFASKKICLIWRGITMKATFGFL